MYVWIIDLKELCTSQIKVKSYRNLHKRCVMESPDTFLHVKIKSLTGDQDWVPVGSWYFVILLFAALRHTDTSLKYDLFETADLSTLMLTTTS